MPIMDAHPTTTPRWLTDRPCTRRRLFKEGAALMDALGALSLVSLPTLAWADDPATQTVTAMDGSSVEVPVSPTRYADAWAEHAVSLALLNGADGLVATAATKSGYPWLYQVVPAMVDAKAAFSQGFSAADVAALDPQLVFAQGTDLAQQFADLDLPLVDVGFSDLDGLKRSLALTAQVLGGDAPQRASDYADDLDALLTEVADATKDLDAGERPTVLYGRAVYEGVVDGTGTLSAEWIAAAGGQDANPDAMKKDERTDRDHVILWNPDVIVTGSLDDAEKILDDPAWDGIAAVRESRVFACPRGLMSWGGPGPELLLQVLWLAGTLYPDRFPADTVIDRARTFYQAYFSFDASAEDVELMLAAQPPEAAER